MDCLASSDISLPDDLDKYSLNVILSRSTRLRDLGRLVWEAKTVHGSQTEGNRLDLLETVEAVLTRAGKPLDYAKLRKEIRRHRGFGETFQIHQAGNIVRLDIGIWGLRDRDVKLTDDQIADGLQAIFLKLNQQGRGLRPDELKQLIDQTSLGRIQNLPSAFWLGMAQDDDRFKLSYGGLIGLSEWESVRRHTFASAFRTIVEASAGRRETFSNILERLKKLDVLPPSNAGVRVELKRAGCTTSDDGLTWTFPPLREPPGSPDDAD